MRTVRCPAPYVEAIAAEMNRRNVDDGDVVLVLCSEPDHLVEVAALVAEQAVVVVVLGELAVDRYTEALTAGAAGVVHIDTSSALTVDVIKAALNGSVSLPRHVAQALAATADRMVPNSDLTDIDKTLLRGLVAGRTVVDLASERFYSERTVRRHLQGIYIKLGVQNRAGAIAAAGRLDLDL